MSGGVPDTDLRAQRDGVDRTFATADCSTLTTAVRADIAAMKAADENEQRELNAAPVTVVRAFERRGLKNQIDEVVKRADEIPAVFVRSTEFSKSPSAGIAKQVAKGNTVTHADFNRNFNSAMSHAATRLAVLPLCVVGTTGG